MGNIRAATMPKWGNVLAHVGQRAYPKWASCLPRMGRFAVRRLPNKLIQRVIRPFNVIFYNCLLPYAFPFISQPSRQLPDNRQAVNYLFVRILRWKTRQSDSFWKIPVFTENQRICASFTHICHSKSILFLSAHHFSSSYVIFWHPKSIPLPSRPKTEPPWQ